MRFRYPFLACLVLSACSATSASLSYLGRPSAETTVQGNSFRVYYDRAEGRAEAHRINAVYPPPSKVAVLEHAYLAITEVTGCKIPKGGLQGDQAIITARLTCPTP